MPRIGKKPIPVPSGVEVKVEGRQVTVKGPKGTLNDVFHKRVQFEQKDNTIFVTIKKPDEKRSRELWGLSRVLVANMVEGVTKGFSKQLEVNGVGYRASMSGKKLVLHVGYSQPVEFEIPEGIEVKVEKNVITVSGINKQQVGQIAAQIREIRKPEPYKGKGIKYMDEQIRRKAGKVVKTAGAG